VENDARRTATFFITGISASGKSTLGSRLRDDLIKDGADAVKLLDGEDIRKELAMRGKVFGYSDQERKELALEYARMAAEYNRKGVTCVLCAICHKEEIREQMRVMIGCVMEVYLDCSVDTCARRDYKGNYEKAFHGLYDNFVGVTKPYEVSRDVELTLHTGKDTVEECSRILLEAARRFLLADSEIRITKAS